MVLYSKAEDIVKELKTRRDLTDYIYDLMKAIDERDHKIRKIENEIYEFENTRKLNITGFSDLYEED